MRTSPRCIFRCLLIVSILLGLVSNSSAIEYFETSNGLSYPQWEGGHTEIEMADLNLDGHIDLISIGDHGSPYINTQEHGVMVYFNDGTGRSWSVHQNGNFGYGGICVGDVNDDGLPDIGYGMHHNYSSNDFGDQLIEVALGDGSGQNWTPWDDGLASQGEDYGMFACDFGDVDNDGDLDIASTSFGSGNPLMIYLNNGDGTWTHSQAVTTGNCSMIVFFGDINKDGNLDVASSYQNGSVFFGNGDGTFFNAMYNLPGSYCYGLSLGDVDNDGGMDISFVNNGNPEVWTFDESAVQWINNTGNLPTGSYGYTHLCDMNADGFCDLAATSSGTVTVWTGNGAGNWSFAASYVIANDPDCYFEAFRVGGDADHNGYPDIVHLTDEGSWINSYNHLRFYRESSLPTSLTCFPVFPGGGELFPVGSVRFTDWLSAVPEGLGESTVDIHLSTTGPAGPWTPVAENVPNNGRLQWIIPEVTTSANCFLKYTVTAGAFTVEAETPLAFTIVSSGVPNVQIILRPMNPPVQIPAAGGSFDYNVEVNNNSGSPQNCNVWIDVTLPGGSVVGPVVNASATIPTGMIERTRTQLVPENAPTGTYSYNSYVGIYPNAIWSSSSFDFEKLGYGDNLSLAGWLTYGEPFEFNENQCTLSPSSFILNGCHPNPFNPSTTISFELSGTAQVRLDVYDIRGRSVGVGLAPTRQYPAGHNAITFDGSHLPSGIYIYRIQAGEYTGSGKMLLLK